MKTGLLLLLLTTMSFAQSDDPEKKDFRFPRNEARTLIINADRNIVGDSIKFYVATSHQATNSVSANAVFIKRNRHAFLGDDEQIFVRDSITGVFHIYITKTNASLLADANYFYQILINDTTRFYGALNILPSATSATVATTYDTSFTNNRPKKIEDDIAGKQNADSAHAQLVLLFNQVAGKQGADSAHTQLVALLNLVAGKQGADSAHTLFVAILNSLGGKGDSDSLSNAWVQITNAWADTVNQVRTRVVQTITGNKTWSGTSTFSDVVISSIVSKIDSLRTPILVRDTTHYVTSDTATYYKLSEELPISVSNIKIGVTEALAPRIGSVTFRFHTTNGAIGTNAMLGTIVADSANGVKIGMIYSTISGYRSLVTQMNFGWTESWNYVYSASNVDNYAGTIRGVSCGKIIGYPVGSLSQINFYLMQAQFSGGLAALFGEIKITYYLPHGSTSSNPIKIINF